MGAFDNRLLSVTVDVDGKSFIFDQSYYILASGTKYTNGSLGECAVRIDNIAKATRDFLVERTSPWIPRRTFVNLSISVGRASKGAFQLFTGQCTAANPSQPPNIGLTFTSLTLGANLGNIGTLNAGVSAPLQSICQQIANTMPNPVTGKNGIPLAYEATHNPLVRNYSFNGSLIRQIEKINLMGGVDAFIDNNTFVVIDRGQARTIEPILLNKDTGMIGVPEVNELGVRVKALIGDEIKVGQSVTVKSPINPGANGTLVIFKIGFEVASREPPFYWDLELRRREITPGFQQ